LGKKKLKDTALPDVDVDLQTAALSPSTLEPAELEALSSLDPSSTPLNVQDFLSFLEEVKHSKKSVVPLALQYSSDLSGICSMIDVLRVASSDKMFSKWLFRLQKKLRKPLSDFDSQK
jgi:hypothetical protein